MRSHQYDMRYYLHPTVVVFWSLTILCSSVAFFLCTTSSSVTVCFSNLGKLYNILSQEKAYHLKLAHKERSYEIHRFNINEIIMF